MTTFIGTNPPPTKNNYTACQTPTLPRTLYYINNIFDFLVKVPNEYGSKLVDF